MHHSHVNRMLAVYALGACEHTEIDAIETHLSQCASCNSEVQPLKQVVAWLCFSAETLPPTSLRSTVLRRARTMHKPSTGWYTGHPQNSRPTWEARNGMLS
jgi:hypothetical protein